MIKKLLGLFASFLVVLTLAGCSNENEDVKDEPGEKEGIVIEYWHAQSSKNGEALQKVVDKFNAENEYGITVNATYQGGYTDTFTKIQSSVVAGEYPNIGQAYGNNIALLLESEKVVNLTPYFEDEEHGYTEEELADFIPSYLDEMFAFEDGNAYQTMMAKSAEVLYYNVDFFEEHNLEVPTTTDELTEVAKKASDILGKPAFGYDSMSNLFIAYSQAFGAEYTDNKGNIFFGNEENKEFTLDFLNWWKDGIDGGYFRNAGEDQYMSTAFTNENCVMFVGSTSGATYLENDKFKWDAAQVPAGPVKQATVQQGGNVFMLDSGNEEENLAAWIFMKYMMEPESTNTYALATGYVPIRKSSYELDEYKTFVAENGSVGHVKDLVLSYDEETKKYDPIFADSYNVRSAVSTILDEITTNEADPEKILDTEYTKLLNK